MSESKIVKQFTKFIYSFLYDDLKTITTATVKSGNGNDMPVFEEFDQRAYELRSGLENLLCRDGGTGTIARCFKLNINCRNLFNLPKRKTDILSFYSRESSTDRAYKVKITDIVKNL